MDEGVMVDLSSGKRVLATSRAVLVVRGTALDARDLREVATSLVRELGAKGALVRALDGRRLELEGR